MKNQYHVNTVCSTLAAGLLLASTAALAHEAGTAGAGYLGDRQQHYVIDSSGNCVRTRDWKPEDMTIDCGAEPPKAEAPPPPPPAPVYETVHLSAKALFDFDKSVIKPEGREAIDAVDDKIMAKGATVVDIKVVGHTDSIGTEEYNQGLSERRAQAVTDYMVSKGINPDLIHTSGMGESDPVASNDTPEGRAQNRRVDVSIGVREEMQP